MSVGKRFALSVKSSDLQSEIFILDGRGRFIARNLGPEHTFHLERGIYRVKVITGTESQERPVALTKPLSKPVEFRPARFVSPVPFIGTSTHHEYHTLAAQNESVTTHLVDGVGSSIFFLVRDWTWGPPRPIRENPAIGLSLYATNGGVDRKIADIAHVSRYNLAPDVWAASTIEVSPGVYELRLVLPDGETLHQSIVALPSWQTQIFMFMRGYAQPQTSGDNQLMKWRADLARTSMLLAPQKGFSENEWLLRLTELARVALGTKRPGDLNEPERRLLPDELRILLRENIQNPMMGIYGGHLLLLEAKPDLNLLWDVVWNLRNLLGTAHPDVEALALGAEMDSTVRPFKEPPMLRRSWSLMVDASIDRPELVTESLAARTSSDLLAEGPWHIWRTGSVEDADMQDQTTLSNVEEALAEHIGVMKHIRRARRDAFRSTADTITSGPSHLKSTGTREDVTAHLEPEHLRSIAERFGMPQNQIRRVLSTMEDKLGRMDTAPNLKVIINTPTKPE